MNNENQLTQSTPIDLSAGLVNEPSQPDPQQQQQAQPQAPAIDLSAGLVGQQPQQPQTGLQKTLSTINGEDDPNGSWFPEVGSELSGAVKSASNGLAGVIDLINKPHGQLLQQPDPGSVKAAMDTYQRIHPQATRQQAADFVQAGISSGKAPASTHLQNIADWLHSGGQPTGFWENIGGLGEQALEWLGGGELLKLAGTPVKVGEAIQTASTVSHLAQANKVAQVLQDNPRLSGILAIGLQASKDALVAGAKDALVTGAKTAFPLAGQNYLHYEDPTQAALVGVTGGALTGGLSGAGKALSSLSGDYANALRAIHNATDEAGVQTALQDHVRDTLGKVAADAGVPAPSAQSLRDAVGELAKSIEGKASSLYKSIDEALRNPGNTVTTNYKTFDQQLRNVRRQLSMSAGIDPEADGKLIEREAALVDARNQAMQTAAAKGVHPNTGPTADRFWAQSKALQDVQKALQKSTQGLRPELATGTETAAPEAVTPTLAKRLNDLYDKGRLQQALSPAHADDLLRSVEVANLKAKQAANAAKNAQGLKDAAKGTAGRIATYGAVAAGVPVAGAAIKHALE
jgi:hypothetical protein